MRRICCQESDWNNHSAGYERNALWISILPDSQFTQCKDVQHMRRQGKSQAAAPGGSPLGLGLRQILLLQRRFPQLPPWPLQAQTRCWSLEYADLRQFAKATRTRPQMHKQWRRSNFLNCSSSKGIKSITSGIYPVIKHLIRVCFWDSEETLGYSKVQIREKILLPLSLLLPIRVPCVHFSLECLRLANNQKSSCDI